MSLDCGADALDKALWDVISSFGVVFAGKPVLHSCCGYNKTTGYQLLDYPSCERKYPSQSFSLWPDHTIIYQPITCSEHYAFNRAEFQIDVNGIVHIQSLNDECFNGRIPNGVHEMDKYCLDYDLMNNILIVQVCFEDATPIPLEQKISSIISTVLLLITVVIYWIKSSPKCSNAAYVISQSTALSLAFVILSGIQFSPKLSDCFECLLAGYCLQYFFLAAFFWMNAHCVHLYLTISRLRPQTGSLALDQMRRDKFVRASLYSWGVPMVICLTTLVLQAFDLIPDPQFRPDIGYDTCFFQSWKVKWIYFYGPMTAIIIVNTVLFSLTFYNLFKHRLLTKNLRQANRTKLQKEIWYCVQYLKLFIVTGISWAGEMIGYAYKNQSGQNDGLDYLWRATDLFNCLQGVFMFIIFVHDKNVLRNLRWPPSFKKCFFCHDQGASASTSLTRTTTSTNVILEMANQN